MKHLNSQKQRVQLAAITALGTLGDPKAAGPLEKLAIGPKESPLRAAAERANTMLNEAKKPAAEVGTLRNEVLSLQKADRDLRKDFDDLKKKLEALSAKPAESKSTKSVAPSKPKK